MVLYLLELQLQAGMDAVWVLGIERGGLFALAFNMTFLCRTTSSALTLTYLSAPIPFAYLNGFWTLSYILFFIQTLQK